MAGRTQAGGEYLDAGGIHSVIVADQYTHALSDVLNARRIAPSGGLPTNSRCDAVIVPRRAAPTSREH
jgi:hypothetical protein